MNYGKNEVHQKTAGSSSKTQKVASKLVLWLVKLVLVLFTVGIILLYSEAWATVSLKGSSTLRRRST